MKLRLLDWMVCPGCKTPFRLQAEATETREYPEGWSERILRFWRNHPRGGAPPDPDALWTAYRTEVLSGELACDRCGACYPILGGIPRILSPELRTMPDRMGRGDPSRDERIDAFMDEAAPVRAERDRTLFQQIQKANQSNYGYEWKAFSHQYDQWDVLYRRNYVSEDESFFAGKFGLDAGCGNARYTLPAVRMGAEMVGVDLSNAIEAAYAKSREVPSYHAIQGDIFNLPFRDDFFDFAQSLGVIHITPDPEAAFQSIKRVVKPGANIYLYVYRTFEEDNLFKHVLLKPVSALRWLTCRLPSNVLYYLLCLMLPVVLLTMYLPSWILWWLPGGRKLSLKFPYNYEQYGHRRLRDMHMNLFDRFGNPVERRYNRRQMEDWMGRAGLDRFVLTRGYGWNVTAVKPEGSPVAQPAVPGGA